MIIDRRYNGPAGSGNGGYTCGMVAAAFDLPAGQVCQVTLRLPPPLDTPLRPERTADRLAVYAGDRLIAEAVPIAMAQLGEPPAPATYEQAAAATESYAGFAEHPFPSCYVCGPRRDEGDGLRIFPGPLPGGGTAALWRVPQQVSQPTVWAALDCPGGWAIIAGAGRPYVLGRMAAQLYSVPPPASDCVVVGEVIGTEGRKAQVRSAVYTRDGGRPLGYARATWIAI
jgi:hypothetical protein